VLGVVAVVVLYLSLNFAYLWVMTPDRIAASPALAADMARTVAGAAGARFVALLIVVSSLGFLAVVILTGPRLIYAMAADGLFFRRAAVLHPRYSTPVFALWFQAAVSLALLTTNTYDQLLSYVVFADWLFFGLTAGALVIVRRRATLQNRRATLSGSPEASLKGSPHGSDQQIASAPGHPWTTLAFIAVAAGIVVNSFFVYPTQSLVGSAILGAAAIAFFVSGRPTRLRDGRV
jgi:APA family basic amino acid/polyamine antiporter